ncbi:MAG: sensor histidine kinase [Firmicutes bacterium]|nr:sensor histidine kinase [Bacillota bacterium]
MDKKRIFAGFRLNHVVAAACMISSVIISMLIAAFSYQIYVKRIERQVMEELEENTRQLNSSLSAWIQDAIQVSDVLYYDVIMNVDYETHDMTKAFELLYSGNETDIEEIVLFNGEGEPVFATPEVSLKENMEITSKEWFCETIKGSENICFYPPHVQNLFQNSQGDYKWTVSMCRPVLLTKGASQTKGVLLISLKYSGLERAMESADRDSRVYLTDQDGNLIYHPEKWLLTAEEKEECKKRALLESGQHREGKRYVSVQHIGYTGWILVNEKDSPLLGSSNGRTRAFYLLIAMIFITVLVLVNLVVSYFVTSQFRGLHAAVQKIQEGDLDVTVEKSGIYEIDHLGNAIMRMASRIKELIKNINEEHEKKRKMEMDALQSQINPHFLYNTLDVIVWMIENGKPREAARAVVMLAKFFRISLSRGETVITVEDELEHVKSYLYIQNLKYKNSFVYHIEQGEGTGKLSTIKLTLQPLVENAICHGIIHMEDEGEIWVRSELREKELLLIVEDNGWGMTEEKVKKLLVGEIQSSGGHSGIGVSNVNQRLKLYFGEEYGLSIQSEPDAGTRITAHLPIVPYGEEALDEET